MDDLNLQFIHLNTDCTFCNLGALGLVFLAESAIHSLQAEGKYLLWVRAVYGSYPGPSVVGVQGQTQLG